MTTKDQEAAKDEAKDEQARQRSAKRGDAQPGTRDDGRPEPTEEDLSFGKANPNDPTLNSYDIDYQAAPARGDVNTTAYQGEPVNPDGFPEDIAEVQENRRTRDVKRTPEENIRAQTGS